ncbi:MAG: glycosyltransferase family 39 protein [Anaerolineae bacterium]
MKRFFSHLGPYVEHGLRLTLFVLLALAALIFLTHSVIALAHRYPLDYGEAPLVDQAQRLAQGENIYRRDLSKPPYTISNYPPLYPLLMTPFVGLFGPSFLPGRLISVLCTMATAGLLGLILHVQTQNRTAALVAAGFFLALRYVVGWSALARVDMLALALSVAALYAVSRLDEEHNAVLIPALLLLGAIYTRQSYGLAAPLAAFVWLWHRCGRRVAFKLASLVAGAGLLLFLILQLLTDGGFFFNIVTANVNPFQWETVIRYARELSSLAPVLLIGAGAFLFLLPGQIQLWPLLTPYLLGATLSAATVGKIGSNVNYLLELSAALSLAAGSLIAWSDIGNRGHADGVRRASKNGWRAYLHAAILLVLAVQAGMLIRETLQNPIEDLKQRVGPLANYKDLTWLIDHAEGPILADEYAGLLTLEGRPLYLQPFEMTQLAQAGLWDQRPLVEEIRAGAFPYIFLHHFMGYPVYLERWTPEMLNALVTAYAPTSFKANTLVFQPRSTLENPPPEGNRCPDAPWRLPSASQLGMWWYNKALGFMGLGHQNSVPVYAVADGLLTRRETWNDAVAIQHNDPLHPGKKVWTFYGGMADSANRQSFVAEAFPPGVENVPVEAGELLGYQGRWWQGPLWVHVHFAITPARADGTFPAALVNRADERDTPLPYDLQKTGLLVPTPYLGLIGSEIRGVPTWLPLQCNPADDTP